MQNRSLKRYTAFTFGRLYTFVHTEHMNIRTEIGKHHGADRTVEQKHIFHN